MVDTSYLIKVRKSKDAFTLTVNSAHMDYNYCYYNFDFYKQFILITEIYNPFYAITTIFNALGITYIASNESIY